MLKVGRTQCGTRLSFFVVQLLGGIDPVTSKEGPEDPFHAFPGLPAPSDVSITGRE